MTDFTNMSGPELVAWYNDRAHKPVQRFASRAAGIRRCEELLEATRFDVQEPPEPAQEQPKMNEPATATAEVDRSAIVAETWQDPEVRAKRSARHACKVLETGTVYRSVPKAFQDLGLDMKRFGKTRLIMVNEGRAEFGGYTFVPTDMPDA